MDHQIRTKLPSKTGKAAQYEKRAPATPGSRQPVHVHNEMGTGTGRAMSCTRNSQSSSEISGKYKQGTYLASTPILSGRLPCCVDPNPPGRPSSVKERTSAVGANICQYISHTPINEDMHWTRLTFHNSLTPILVLAKTQAGYREESPRMSAIETQSASQPPRPKKAIYNVSSHEECDEACKVTFWHVKCCKVWGSFNLQ